MPKRIPTFRPARPIARAARPTAAARGYCTAAWERTRLAIIARDQGVCQLCGLLVIGEGGDIDHVLEKAKGGTDALENLRLTHRSCHAKRHAQDASR
jgi:5-methylcytosine-specific restriction protein A